MSHRQTDIIIRLEHEECDDSCHQPCPITRDLRLEAADLITELRHTLQPFATAHEADKPMSFIDKHDLHMAHTMLNRKEKYQ